MMKIWIDPGHGMANRSPGVFDPGAVSGKLTEADIVLQVALVGRQILTAAGHAVGLTRDDNSDPSPVGTRDDRAKAWGANLFISLHMNASDNPSATGTETFYRDAADKKLAEMVQSSALSAFYLRDRQLKTESASQHSRLAVLDFPGPACLVELGFISNATDVAAIMRPQAQVNFWKLFLKELEG
jgi:N-acetylmuramoyl-L-alanine amidase